MPKSKGLQRIKGTNMLLFGTSMIPKGDISATSGDKCATLGSNRFDFRPQKRYTSIFSKKVIKC